MILDRNILQEYPFTGKFYYIDIDESKPLEERVPEEFVLLETPCDIQESQKSESGSIHASFNIYFPFKKEDGINIKRGDLFVGYMYGMKVDGQVIGVFPTQMGGCEVYLMDNTSGNQTSK
jgi:hypothetical protein